MPNAVANLPEIAILRTVSDLEHSMATEVIGIDLGTTNSAVDVIEGGEPTPARLPI
jgi:molecular chaperone DnaK (HSP70)